MREGDHAQFHPGTGVGFPAQEQEWVVDRGEGLESTVYSEYAVPMGIPLWKTSVIRSPCRTVKEGESSELSGVI